jgi:two-component system, cell cycle response regulator DivK
MKKPILVVEDNPANRRLLHDVLEYYGYDVIEAENGKDGIKLAAERLPDLILMDIQMPVMNGFTAISLLKKDSRTKNIKVIAVTSFAMAGDRDRVMQSGADEYISKPINTRELPEIVKRLIGG